MSAANRFRFRAWCDEHGYVLAEYHHYVGGMEAWCDKHDVYTGCTIEQSTGLTDSAGVEITSAFSAEDSVCPVIAA